MHQPPPGRRTGRTQQMLREVLTAARTESPILVLAHSYAFSEHLVKRFSSFAAAKGYSVRHLGHRKLAISMAPDHEAVIQFAADVEKGRFRGYSAEFTDHHVHETLWDQP